ncbi:alpha/beta hydrolase [Methylobacterium sp. SyP6R]|uniref:alpha/beta hydrolase n=1 Tax=Methylobacterium sp. SyP6R TaxID=2718876 RepID=UPI001F197B51|nr:alpha/beta hydrolase [Methylobacterium sp. SyP6R]MCF4125266.1 alpha/beta hydrolase [Methylobacterium sp. SyP6R]
MSGRLVIIVLLGLCMGGTFAQAGEIRGVPLPDDVSVVTVPDAVPRPASSFLGAWIGTWSGLIPHVLIVERVDPDGQGAQVVYALAAAPEFRIERQWRRGRATISGHTLTLEGSAPATYILDGDTLEATYRRDTVRDYARMRRVALSDLTDAAQGLDWSEPQTTFVEGPVENGAPTRLEVAVFRPPGPGPFPLLVFNHGSTGLGRDPASFTRTYVAFPLADDLVRRGWMVAFPQRRGRGRSGGLYDEGFDPDRSKGYTCDAPIALAGAERALADVEAAAAALRRRDDVAPGPILIGGQSRGGALAIAFAGRHPDLVRGVLNFVGGWLGEACASAAEVNATLLRSGAAFPGPTLWLYGRHDAYFSIAHSRRSFDAFRAAGGTGEFLTFDVPGRVGHAVGWYRDLWQEPVGRYLDGLGTPSPR